MSKKICAALLAVFMVITMLPMAAGATETKAETPLFVPANLGTGTGEEFPNSGLVDSYSIGEITPSATQDDETITVSINATNLQKHKNGNGESGYWLGIGYLQEDVTEDAEYPLYATGGGTEEKHVPKTAAALEKNQEHFVQQGSSMAWHKMSVAQTTDGHKYVTHYFKDCDDDKANGFTGLYWFAVKTSANEVKIYRFNLNGVTFREAEEPSEPDILRAGFAWKATDANTDFDAAIKAVRNDDIGFAAKDADDQSMWMILDNFEEGNYTYKVTKDATVYCTDSITISSDGKENPAFIWSPLDGRNVSWKAFPMAGGTFTISIYKESKSDAVAVKTVAIPNLSPLTLTLTANKTAKTITAALPAGTTLRGNYKAELYKGETLVEGCTISGFVSGETGVEFTLASGISDGTYTAKILPVNADANAYASGSLEITTTPAPPGPSGPSTPVNPTPPTPDNTVTVTPPVSGGTASTTLPADQGNKLIEQAQKPSTDEVTVKVEPTGTEKPDTIKLDIPAATVSGVGAADSSLTVETDVANITIPSGSLASLGENASTITITASKKADGTVEVTVAKDGAAVDSLPGGVKAQVPVSGAPAKGTVAVVVDENGKETILPKSIVDGGGMQIPLEGSATVKIIDNSKDFTDTAGHWGKDSIDFASSHELFKGTTETTFAPDLAMTRGMIVTVLHRLESEPAGGSISFGDVKPSDYFAEAAAWASQNHIAQGTGAGFEPDKNVTRQDLATFLYRYAQAIKLDTAGRTSLGTFPDGEKAACYSKEALEWCVNAGIIRGNSDSTLNPLGNATRAEVATMLMRFVAYIHK